jgi:uncharacterized delta-60 repeat protein
MAFQGAKILLAGASFNGTDNDFALTRLNADGSLDTSFGSGGTVVLDLGGDDMVTSVLVNSADNTIVLVGSSGTDAIALARFTADGVLDTSFDAGDADGDGKLVHSFGTGVELVGDAVLAGGDIVIASSASGPNDLDFRLTRFTTAGVLVSTVFTDFGGNDIARGMIVDGNGKIVVTGDRDFGSARFATARYNADGTLDATFDTDGKAITGADGDIDTAEDVAIQADGKIVLAGNIGGFVPDGPNIAVVCYGADGTLDSSFGAPVYVPFHPAVVLAPDGHLFDAELAALGAAGNYDGATVTLQRHGGANANDVFIGLGLLNAFGLAGDDIVVSGPLGPFGVHVGTIVQNSGGVLSFTFNANATQDLVDAVLYSIGYFDGSTVLPPSVQIDFTVSESNLPGALTATGSVVVTIDPNEAPAFVPHPASLRTDFGPHNLDDAAAMPISRWRATTRRPEPSTFRSAAVTESSRPISADSGRAMWFTPSSASRRAAACRTASSWPEAATGTSRSPVTMRPAISSRHSGPAEAAAAEGAAADPSERTEPSSCRSAATTLRRASPLRPTGALSSSRTCSDSTATSPCCTSVRAALSTRSSAAALPVISISTAATRTPRRPFSSRRTPTIRSSIPIRSRSSFSARRSSPIRAAARTSTLRSYG